MTQDQHRYRAFLSYAHADEAFAARLHARLERYRLPARLVASRALASNRLGTVFRDRDELASSASLTAVIREALASSGALIVVCSPDAAASRWVDAEVRAFRELRPRAPVLLIVADHVPAGALDSVFPPAIRGDDEPLAADARAAGDGFDRALLKIVAGLLGVGFDELRQREMLRRRQRRLTGAAAAVALVASFALGAWLVQQAEQEAADQRAQAAALVAYLVDDLDARLADYEKVGELDAGLGQALSYFATLDPKDVDADTLEKYRTALIGVGSVRIRQGKPDEALEVFERAAEVGRTAVGRDAESAADWYALAQNTYYIGEAYWEMQDVAAAAERIRQALAHARRAAALEPDEVAYQLELVFQLNNVGAVDTRLKRYDAAVVALEESLALNAALRERFPAAATDLVNQEVESASWLAEIVPTIGRFDEAFGWHEREIALREGLYAETGNIHHQARLSDALGYYARTLSAVGRTEEAARVLERKIEISERLVREDPDNVFWRTRLCIGQGMLAEAVFQLGDSARALGLLDAGEAELEALRADGRHADVVGHDIAYFTTNRAYVALAEDATLAARLAARAIEALDGALDSDPVNPIALGYLVRASLLGAAAARASGAAIDTQALERTLALVERAGEPDTSIYDKAARGLLLLALGREDAERVLEEVRATGYRSAFFSDLRRRLTVSS